MDPMRFISVAAALLLAAAAATAPPTLRGCAADDDLPYRTGTRPGLRGPMGMGVERVPFADPRYIVRDGIDKDMCDVMLGVDSGDPRLQTTSPYYRSSYV